MKGRAPKDSGTDVKVDAGMDSRADVPSADRPAEVMPPVEAGVDVPPVCNQPVPGCTADTTKICDPTCQSGCTGCHQKCSINTKGALTCNEPSATGRLRGLLEPCDITSVDAPSQTDSCAPGLVCRLDGCSPSGRCYAFCKADKDCPSSQCSIDAGGGTKVCDVPAATCNPVKSAAGDGCGTESDLLVCYLSPKVADRTVCDCPIMIGGVNMAGGVNSSCTVSHDCFPGLVCAASVCRPACNLMNPASCQLGQCTQLNGSTKFGYCN